MYLRNLHIRNIGPLEKIDLEFDLIENSNPRPVILVGKNGSGKTYTLSYIVDAFYELAKDEFSDVVNNAGTLNTPYFKIISVKDINIATNEKSGSAYVRFMSRNDESGMHYCEKVGNVTACRELINLYGNKINGISNEINNQKKTQADSSDIKKFYKNTVAFFPSFRKIIPHWLNVNAQKEELFSVETKFDGKLNKEIMCIDTFDKNIQWMLDVILDSAILPAELDYFETEALRKSWIDDKHTLNNAYRNINKIFQTILENEECYLKTGWRNETQSRLSLYEKGKQIIPSLDQLSTGQLILLNLFITIIRHADYSDINNSIRLIDIEGIIVVDEIDAHLHTKHQSEILPKLIKLFPKVQFIMTSHSPLFVLGMEKEFGCDNVQLIDLPSGINITSERFGEFEESFNFYQNTAKFEETLHQKIKETQRPLILVEGETDVKYLKKALELFQKTDWIELLQIDEGGLSEQGGSKNSGQDSLKKGFDFLLTNKKSFQRKVLFLFDCDAKNFNEHKDGHIFKMKVRHNVENTKVSSGVENLLPESVFESDFYSKEIKETGDGGRATIEKLKKQEFCDFVCNSNNKEIFEKYGEFIFPIIEEFLES